MAISNFCMCACAVGFLATAGCVSIDAEDCDARCGADQTCPAGFECKKGFCVHPNSSATCEVPAPAGGGTSGTETADAGGTAQPSTSSNIVTADSGVPVGAAGAGNGGSGPIEADGSVAGDSSVAGVGGMAGCSAAPPLSIEVPQPARGCTGRPSSVTFNASGGIAPYTWAVASNDAGFVTSSFEGNSVQLMGTPKTAALQTLSLTLQDSCQNTASNAVMVDVRDPPQLASQDLPEGCFGVGYSWQVLVSGGDSSSYKLSLSGLPDAVGLSAVGNTLSGRLGASDNSPFKFNISVGDDYCNPAGAVPVPFTLVVQADGDCPIAPHDWEGYETAAPATPCRAEPYQASFWPGSGASHPLKPPLTWDAVSLPAGFEQSLADDAGSLAINGTSDGPSTVTLLVTDSADLKSRHLLVSYDLVPRDKCWLAFTSNESSARRLYLFDPILGSDLSFPRSARPDVNVVDFQFSPDGRSLAYRFTGSAGPSLALLQGPTWQEQPLTFPGSVTNYQWSPDSAALAVSYQDATGTLLGGVDLSHDSPQLLNPARMPVASDLTWFAGNHARVAFQTTGSVGFATLNQDAQTEIFSSYTSVGTSYAAPQVKAGADGFFVFDPPTKAGFYAPRVDVPAQSPIAFNHGYDVVSPSGTFTAHAAGSTLDLFLAASNSDGTPPPNPQSSAAGCGTLLTWAEDRERIACVFDTGNPTVPGEVRIFDVDSTQQLSAQSTVLGLSGYRTSSSLNHRRAFSRSGNWLALVTDASLFLIDLRAANATLFLKYDLNLSSTDPSNVELSFSPDEHYFLLQVESGLLAYSLLDATLGVQPVNSESIEPVIACVEVFSNAPTSWCGRGAPRSEWSPEVPLTVHLTSDGGLEAVDFSTFDIGGVNSHTILHACSQCVGTFAFQP